MELVPFQSLVDCMLEEPPQAPEVPPALEPDPAACGVEEVEADLEPVASAPRSLVRPPHAANPRETQHATQRAFIGDSLTARAPIGEPGSGRPKQSPAQGPQGSRHQLLLPRTLQRMLPTVLGAAFKLPVRPGRRSAPGLPADVFAGELARPAGAHDGA